MPTMAEVMYGDRHSANSIAFFDTMLGKRTFEGPFDFEGDEGGWTIETERDEDWGKFEEWHAVAVADGEVIAYGMVDAVFEDGEKTVIGVDDPEQDVMAP